MALILAVQEWRHQRLEVYFTVDAGQNVHLLCKGESTAGLEAALGRALLDVGGRFLVSAPGRGAWIAAEHQV